MSTQLFTEGGFLTEDGKRVLQPFREALIDVLCSNEVRGMSVQEMQILQANLAKLVGDILSDATHLKSLADEIRPYWCVGSVQTHDPR